MAKIEGQQMDAAVSRFVREPAPRPIIFTQERIYLRMRKNSHFFSWISIVAIALSSQIAMMHREAWLSSDAPHL
jgi:hypothetical protein